MALGKLLRNSAPGLLLGWGARLRFPYLFLITALIFVADLMIPDVIPMADEIIIGLATLLLANLKKKTKDSDNPTTVSEENHR